MTHIEEPLDVIIVGGGVAGLYMLHRARRAGLAARLFEAADGVGGTWYWNRYPGARVDIESMEYSYSFSDELYNDWHWTERYASQPELLRYFNYVAERFGLYENIQLGTRVTSAHFDERDHRWIIRSSRGERISAAFCVMATGCLSAPKTPDIVGFDTFEGECYFTSRWPHEQIDFRGKRVGVIGTGSSGIQLIPKVAEQATHLTVFQRTANFSAPLRNRPMDSAYEQTQKAAHAELRRMQFNSFGGFVFVDGVATKPLATSALSVTAEQRTREFERRWEAGGLCFYTSYADLLVSQEANDALADFFRRKIRERVADPTVAETLMPKGHPILTKRLCADTGYYETYNRENVVLVDLQKTPIQEITSKTVVIADDAIELDMIVFATGFDAVTGALLNIDIRGREGLELKEQWAQGPDTYLGLMTAGFPNLFNVAGPGSTASLTSAIQSDEHQVDVVMKLIEHVRHGNQTAIEATLEAQNNWTAHIREVADSTLFPRANSWYVGANVPGKPRGILLYLGGFDTYIRKCDEAIDNDFAGFVLSRFSESQAVVATSDDMEVRV